MNPALRAVLLSPAFTPARLFRAGEQGAWFDPSDLSTMFQDSAGTTPAAVNSPVGKILDKSGRGNHATQGTDLLRPTLKQDASGLYYLEFTDHALATSAINFTATDKMTVFAGVLKASDAAAGVFLELSNNWNTTPANAGTFIVTSLASAAWLDSGARGTATVNANQVATPAASYASPYAGVLTATHDIAGDSSVVRINGRQAASATGDKGSGNFKSDPIYIGRRGGTSLPFNGRIYGLVIRGSATTDTNIVRAERWMAKKTGVSL